MEATASKPEVPQQFGMIVGIPNAGQLNAIGTLNIRGERSVTCWGEFDKHPSLGPLPPAAPPVCEFFRQQPDALERAAELDKAFGKNPDLEKMPMYGVVFSFKDPFDTKDMRSTGGGDARYDIDFPARDHVLVEQLRNKGAIIFAKAVNTEYNGRAGDPGGRNKPDKVLPSTLGYQRSTWAGNPSNPYDTTRSASLGSSSGSGVSVSANFVMASLGEETRASCRGPSNHNAIALILPHKAMLGFDGGAIGADIYCDRARHSCAQGRRLREDSRCAEGPGAGLLRSARSVHHGAALVGAEHALCRPRQRRPARAGALKGMRLGVIRESMVYPTGSKTEEPIVNAATKEIKTVLGGQLGATLVEFGDPLWKPDPERRADDGRLPQGAGAARAGVHAGPVVPREGGRHAGVSGFRRGDRADRVRAGKSLRLGHDAADRLLRRDGGGPDRAAAEPRPRHHPESGDGDGVPLPHLAIPDAPRRRLEGEGLQRDADRLGRSSTRARSSGATISARRSRTGRRSPIRATRTVRARASTSASCCASCCAAST